MQETYKTQVRFLSQEDPLEKEMATYSNIHTWRIQWTVDTVISIVVVVIIINYKRK